MSVIKIDGNFDLGNMTDPSLAISCVNNVQSSVKSFLPGFGNGWPKYCAIVQWLSNYT